MDTGTCMGMAHTHSNWSTHRESQFTARYSTQGGQKQSNITGTADGLKIIDSPGGPIKYP